MSLVPVLRGLRIQPSAALVTAGLVLIGALALVWWSRETETVRVKVTVSLPDFHPPNRDQRNAALGPLGTNDPPLLRAALTHDSAFAPIPTPGPSDWLAFRLEPGQTYTEFVASRPNRPEAVRSVIYLQPLGSFDDPGAPSLEFLRRFAGAFFDLTVSVQPPRLMPGPSLVGRRLSSSGTTQFLTGDLLQLLSKDLPPDAYCRLGLTMEDLYPGPSWNFVFGQASLNKRVGIYSFARYTASPSDALLRSCKVLAHETGHMFGLHHCVYYSCLMNGSNHLDELDAQPLHLCPICLRKLHSSVGFDVEFRYRRLRDLSREVGFSEEAGWIEGELQALADAGVDAR
jgi:archaemetzincin